MRLSCPAGCRNSDGMDSGLRLGRAHHSQRIPHSITPPPPLPSPDIRSSPPPFPRGLVGRRAGNTADGLAGRNAAHHLVQFFAHDAPPVRVFVAVSGVFTAQAHARTAHAGLLQVVERAVGVAGQPCSGCRAWGRWPSSLADRRKNTRHAGFCGAARCGKRRGWPMCLFLKNAKTTYNASSTCVHGLHVF